LVTVLEVIVRYVTLRPQRVASCHGISATSTNSVPQVVICNFNGHERNMRQRHLTAETPELAAQ